MAQKYRPSGTASVSGVLKTLLFGTLASLILPIIYIILNRLIPNIWFAAICAMLLGLLLGYFIDLGVKIGKIRNLKIAVSIATFCGILAFYFQWVIFDELMYSQKGFTFNLNADDIKILAKDIFYLFMHPGILIQEIGKLNEVGTFKIQGSGMVSGFMLWLIWACEFLVILGSIIYAVYEGQVSKPYSELNDTWMEKRKNANRIDFVNDKSDFLNALDTKNYAVLHHNNQLLDINNYAEVYVYESYGDPLKFIDVLNVHNTVDKKGKITTKKIRVFRNLQLINVEV